VTARPSQPRVDIAPERWREIDRIFCAALDAPLEHRDAIVARECGTDAALREHVMRLLAADVRAEELLGESAAVFAGPMLIDELSESAGDALPEGQRVGAYRILRELGRGGMGTVYLAERADGQFDQRVALKVVKRGMDTDEVLLRFKYERRILASLEQPNIARLLDGGATDDGRPYLVLELVDGEPIDRYCDAMRLSIEGRLDLFGVVCDAVQYAHQNLVIHRDLKPSNILITTGGIPKLLDFGIAKLLDTAAATDTPRTRTGILILTPEYAAPEQLRGESVTTAMDVYSLGVILFSLLAGKRPSEIARPSTVIARLGSAARDIADARRTTGDKLVNQLKGDLDTITLKALAPEPERRYGSAQQLASDIRRYRRGLPVAAQADSAWYRTKKFVARHRMAVGAAAAVVVMLAGFATYVAVQQAETAHQRDRAQRERDKANQVVAFLTDMLGNGDPSRARGDTLTIYQLLARSQENIDTALAAQPEVRAEIMNVLGNVYAGLGDFGRAQSLLSGSLDIRHRMFGDENRDVTETRAQLASVLTRMANYPAAESTYKTTLAGQRVLFGDKSAEVARTLHGLGEVSYWKGEHRQAADYFDRAIAILRGGVDDPLLTAAVLTDFAELRRAQNEFDKAEPMLREGLAIRRERLGADHPLTASSISSLATLLRDRGNVGEAEPLFREALAIRRRILGEQHPDYAKSLVGLAYTLQKEGKYDDAESAFRQALSINLKRHGPTHPEIGFDLNAIGKVLYDKGSLAASESAYRRSLELLRSALGQNHIRVTMPLTGLGTVLDARGQSKEALPLLRQAVALRIAEFGKDHRLTTEAESALGTCLLHVGKFAEAEVSLSHVEEALAKTVPVDTQRLSLVRADLAAARRGSR
jgi:tetratricopeptide (TPR) repeat protein